MPDDSQSPRRASNRDRLHPRLALMVVLALAPAVGMCVFISYEQHRGSVARVNADALRVAELAAAGQEGVMESTRQLLVALAELPQMKARTNSALLDTHFRNLLRLFPACVEFGLVEPDGRLFAGSSPKAPRDAFARQPFLKDVAAGGRFSVGGYEPETNGRPAGLWFGHPIPNAANGASGVLYAVVDLRVLGDVAVRARLPAGAELAVCDSRGVVLARHPDPDKWVGRSVAQVPLFRRATEQEGGTAEMKGLDGETLLFAFAPIRAGSDVPLKVWVGIPKEGAYAATQDTLALMLILLGLVAVMAWAAARWYAAARILRPVNQLVSAAGRLGAGDWTARTNLPHGRGELGQLARTFDELAQTLQRKQGESERAAAELRAAEAKFRTLVEQSLVGIYIIQDGDLVYVNPKFGEIVGRAPDELAGRPVLEIVAEPDRALAAENIRRRLEGREISIRYHLRCARPDGSFVHCEAHGATAEVNGRPAIIGALLDVTEQVQAESEIRRLNAELEQRVAQRTAELEVANKELEAFAYSVSHDLRAPLRHINGFVQLLASGVKDQLDERNARYLGMIGDSARQMGQLIDDLLEFSRMGRVEMHAMRVDLEELVRDVRRELEPDTRDRRIVWKNGGLPEVEGDPAMLKQVFVNLISNAVKYTRQRDPAVIEIGSAESPDEVVVHVRDNGAGFDMQYAHKLFGVFQRLHRAEEFEGTGIGLANVRRIVARHGGRAWAEGEPGKGATFFVSLPKSATGDSNGTETHTPG